MARRILLPVAAIATLCGIVLSIAWFFTRPSNGQLAITIHNKPTVMTIAYKAYGSSDAAKGKYWLSKTALENTGASSLKNVRVSYQIPDYVGWTTPDETPELLPNQTAVFVFYPKLPTSVTQIRSKTPSTLEIKIEYTDNNGPQTRIEKREFAFRGITEIEYTSLSSEDVVNWYDAFDNAELLSAFVCDEDPAVKAYCTKISEVSGGLDVVSNVDQLTAVEKSIYNFMVSTGMTYSGDKGVPEQVGDATSLTQSIRLPRDVMYGDSGLCVELALLWCSLGESLGARPYLVLLPGHAFTILQDENGDTLPIECTAVGGGTGGNLEPAASFDDAIKAGKKEWAALMAGKAPFILVDIQEYQQEGIRPPELADIDRPAFSKMLDDQRTAHARPTPRQNPIETAGAQQPQQYQPVPQPAVQPAPQPTPEPAPQPQPTVDPAPQPTPQPAPQPQPTANMKSWSNGDVTVSYPANWTPLDLHQIQQVVPGYLFNATDTQLHETMEVMTYDGASTAAEAVAQFQQIFQRMGGQVKIDEPQQIKMGGKQAIAYSITLTAADQTRTALLVFVQVRNKMMSVGVGAPKDDFDHAAPIFSDILSSVHFNN
jgi:hypothetical protein